MTQIERIEQLSRDIISIDSNGLRIEVALVHLELSEKDFDEFVNEWKNRIDSTVSPIGRYGLAFNGIDFSITEKR